MDGDAFMMWLCIVTWPIGVLLFYLSEREKILFERELERILRD